MLDSGLTKVYGSADDYGSHGNVSEKISRGVIPHLKDITDEYAIVEITPTRGGDVFIVHDSNKTEWRSLGQVHIEAIRREQEARDADKAVH